MTLRIVTGFEPFLGRKRNRSWEAVRRLPPRPGLETLHLPVAFASIEAEIVRILERRPSVLLLVGEAPGRFVRVEQIAVNVADTNRPDNAGERPAAAPLVAGGALALAAPWDAHAVAESIRRTAVRVRPSFHAGTYLCNAALYHALDHALAHPPPGTHVGFLHVPRRAWPWGPSLDALVRATEIALEALAPL